VPAVRRRLVSFWKILSSMILEARRMARATAGRRRTPRRVILSLTEGEADYLLGLISQVAGNHRKSPHKYGVRIEKALEEALGYNYSGSDAYAHAVGHVHFRNYDTPPVEMRERILTFIAVAKESVPELMNKDLQVLAVLAHLV